MARRCLTLLCWAGFSTGLCAQPDTLFSLPAVEVRAFKPEQTGFATWSSDSLPLPGNLSLADLLLWENAVTLRAGAPGTLATVSARGSGPSHTAIIWQGINLQSSMNGVADAALLPLWPGDKTEIRYGGQSAAQSSGAMGGALHIDVPVPADSLGWSTQVAAESGSFGHRASQFSAGYGQPGGGALLRAAWQRADNDFLFHNTSLIGAPAARQVNNFGEKIDIQQFYCLKINDKNEILTALWYQRAYREIPPSMTEAPKETWQRDRALRAVMTWNHPTSQHAFWQHRLAWLDEAIGFFLSGDLENSRARTAIASSEYTLAPSQRLTLKGNLSGWLQYARADGYSDSTRWFRQGRLAGLATAEYRWRNGRLSGSLRQEWVERQAAPFTWTLGAQWNPGPAWLLRAHLSRDFNLPTFNDRYWKSLGNPNLKPESGYSADAGLEWRYRRFSAGATIFQLLLDDWILWQPGADGLFRPDNLRQVWSRGAELNVAWAFQTLGSQWKIGGLHRFVRATNTAVYDGSDFLLHRQLPYTPQHSSSATVHWSFGHWSATYLHQWTGSRFRTADNSITLPAFDTGNFLMQYAFSWKSNRFALHFRLENCWNTAYQIFEYQPMPGRAWRFGLGWGMR